MVNAFKTIRKISVFVRIQSTFTFLLERPFYCLKREIVTDDSMNLGCRDGAVVRALASGTNVARVRLGPVSYGGRVAEWFRALDLKSGGPWFKSSTLPLSGFVLGSPEFNSSTALCK